MGFTCIDQLLYFCNFCRFFRYTCGHGSSSAFCAGAISDVVPEEAELEEAVLDVSVPPDPEEAVPDAVLPFGVTFTSSKVPPVPAF